MEAEKITFEEFEKLSVPGMLDYLYEHGFLETIENDYMFMETNSYEFNEHVDSNLPRTVEDWRNIFDTLRNIDNVNNSCDWVYIEWMYDSWDDMHELSQDELARIVTEYDNDDDWPFVEAPYKTDCSGLVDLI